jgi:ribosomal protein S18 acetylase RimI-like enzyme
MTNPNEGTRDRISIRPIQVSDYAAIAELWSEAGLPVKPAGRDAEPAFRRQLARFPTTYLVAEDAGRIVGVILGTHDERKGWINRLAVHPDYRRRGMGLQLIAACEQALHALGIGIVAALVEADNDPSAATFRAAGYVSDVPVHYFRKLQQPGI